MPLVAAHGSSSPRGRVGICIAGLVCAVDWLPASAVGVYEAVCRPAGSLSGRMMCDCLADTAVPGLPLAGGVRDVVGEQQRLATQRTQSLLQAQSALPGLGQLRRFAFASPVGPILGQRRVVG